jgi:hypothetical protein
MDGMMKGSNTDVGFDINTSINQPNSSTVLHGEFIETITQPLALMAFIF